MAGPGRPGPARKSDRSKQIEVLRTKEFVLDMWREGFTYASIATLSGYSVWSVGEIVRGALRQLRSNSTMEEHRANHFARLEEVYEQLFPVLMRSTPDRSDVASLLDILDRQSRLLGLDAPKRVVTSVGVPSNENEMREFVATLMAAVGSYQWERTAEITEAEQAELPPAQEPEPWLRAVRPGLEKVPARVVPGATSLEHLNDASELPEPAPAVVDRAERERREQLQVRMQALFAV